MRFVFADSLDTVDPDYNFVTDRNGVGRIGRAFLHALDTFETINPLLRGWGYFDMENIPRGVSIASLRPKFTEFVEAHVDTGDDSEKPGPPSPEEGYTVYASNDYRPNGMATDHSVQFLVHAGSQFRNAWSFSIGSRNVAADLSLITYSLYRSVLLTALEIWPAPWAHASAAIWSELPAQASGDPSFPYSGYQLPWISYLCAERAAAVDVPPEVITERTPDGGLFMIAAEERLDPRNHAHMRASKAIAEIMIKFGGNPD